MNPIGTTSILIRGQFPSGWTCCHGQLLSIELNPSLFAVIGNKWGGDGTQNFALPPLIDLGGDQVICIYGASL